MSERTKKELLITGVILVIELIIGLIIRLNIYEFASIEKIILVMTGFLAGIITFNLFYGIVLIIINTNNIGNNKADKQEKIEDRHIENKTDKPE